MSLGGGIGIGYALKKTAVDTRNLTFNTTDTSVTDGSTMCFYGELSAIDFSLNPKNLEVYVNNVSTES
jgi:hypothetical protein